MRRGVSEARVCRSRAKRSVAETNDGSGSASAGFKKNAEPPTRVFAMSRGARERSRRNDRLSTPRASGLTNIHGGRASSLRSTRAGSDTRARRDARSRTHLELAHERGFRVVVLVQGPALAREHDARPRRCAPRLVQKLTGHLLGRRLGAFPLGLDGRPRVAERAPHAFLVVDLRGRVEVYARVVERERHGRARVVRTRASWSDETRVKRKRTTRSTRGSSRAVSWFLGFQQVRSYLSLIT